jgi:hypothetical protein
MFMCKICNTSVSCEMGRASTMIFRVKTQGVTCSVSGHIARLVRFKMQRGAARGSQEQAWAAERKQQQQHRPGAARSSQGQPEAAMSSKEIADSMGQEREHKQLIMVCNIPVPPLQCY